MKLYKKFEPITYYFVWIYMNILFYHNGHYFPLLFSNQGWAILKSINFMPPILVLIPIAVLTLSRGGSKK
jgi:hypothetical protein